MTKFSSLTHSETETGEPITILTMEGVAADVACYIISGEHDDKDYVLRHGMKMTERAARDEGANWPARLSYRR